MGLQRSRLRISTRGLGTLALRKVEPVSEAIFQDAGYLGATALHDTVNVEEILGEDGSLQDVKLRSRIVTVESALQQTGRDEFDLLRSAADCVHAVRYYGTPGPGRFQYFCFDLARLNPGISVDFKAGLRQIPLKFWAIDQDERKFPVPLYTMVETAEEIMIEGLQLWINPPGGLNEQTLNLLDISGFGRHGIVAGCDVASDIWKTDRKPEKYLRFGENGLQAAASFGDILPLNGADDMMFEAWFRIEAADGTECRMFGKRASSSTGASDPGYLFFRNAENKMCFWCADGAAVVSLTTEHSYTHSSGWIHAAIILDRGGTSRMFVNGAPDGEPAQTTVADCATADPFLLGANGSQHGDFSCGDFRAYDFGPNGLPPAVEAIAEKHFRAQRRLYGV